MTAPRGEAAPTARQRPVRGAPSDIPFGFPDEGLARALASERTEPGWLRDERRAAAKAYASLPVETNPLYTTYVDLRPADLDGVRPYVRTAAAPRMERGTPVVSVPEGTAGIIEIREDVVAALALAPEAASAGVVLETFASALKRDPKGLRADLEGGGSLPADDKLAQLTRGYWSQGVRLVVPDGVRIDRPILLRWAAGAPGRALLTRTLIRLGAEAGASIVEELVPAGAPVHGRGALLTGTTEVVLGRGASLAVASIQEMGPNQVVFGHRHATLGDDAALHWALGQLGGRLTRSRVDNLLAGNRSSVEQVEIVFGAGEQLFDLTSYTRHVGRDTTGNLLAKGVLMDAARSFMKGLITIEKSAVGTDSFLGEFGMNLSKRARAVAIPSLEIDQPDCRRAMHSSAVGPIDEAQVFYLESRGIRANEARKFIVLGFLEPVVARVPHPEAEERLRRLLDEKWSVHVGTTAAA